MYVGIRIPSEGQETKEIVLLFLFENSHYTPLANQKRQQPWQYTLSLNPLAEKSL